MKINIFILFAAFFLITLMGCKQEKEIEPTPPPVEGSDKPDLKEEAEDKALLDLIYNGRPRDQKEYLYDKPLQVIQSSIIGKWKVGIAFGGFAGVLFPVNQYITIDETTFDANYITPLRISSFDYEWRYLKTYTGYETYVMWDKQNDINAGLEHYVPNGYVFDHLLHNDTLYMKNYGEPTLSDILIRVKE
jgi:hypothetical protein